MHLLIQALNLKPKDCSCPACLASGPRPSPLRQLLNHDKRYRLLGFVEPGADPADVTALAQHGVPDPPDLRAAIEARNASTSKNIQNRPGPEPKYPSRPVASPHVDQLAREKFGVDRLVDSPPADALKNAIKKARS